MGCLPFKSIWQRCPLHHHGFCSKKQGFFCPLSFTWPGTHISINVIREIFYSLKATRFPKYQRIRVLGDKERSLFGYFMFWEIIGKTIQVKLLFFRFYMFCFLVAFKISCSFIILSFNLLWMFIRFYNKKKKKKKNTTTNGF